MDTNILDGNQRKLKYVFSSRESKRDQPNFDRKIIITSHPNHTFWMTDSSGESKLPLAFDELTRLQSKQMHKKSIDIKMCWIESNVVEHRLILVFKAIVFATCRAFEAYPNLSPSNCSIAMLKIEFWVIYTLLVNYLIIGKCLYKFITSPPVM